MKQCTKCKEEKQFSQYNRDRTSKDGLRSSCKLCLSAQRKIYLENNKEKDLVTRRKYREKNREKILTKQKQYREKNKEKILERNRKYRENNRERVVAIEKKSREKNKEKVVEWNRKYREKNREKIIAKRRKYRKRKMATCPMYRMVHCLRQRLRAALRGKCKSASTMALLGCTFKQVKKHLEKQFVEGMSWENYGEIWHTDHMRPCASFDLSDAEQQRRCFHYSNLQPLFASENMSKGNKDIYGPYMKFENDEWHININGEYMSRSRQVEERIPTQYFYPIKWMLLKYNA